MDQAAFAHVLKSSQGQPAKVAAALEHGKTSFHNLGPAASQPFTFVASSATAVAMELPAGFRIPMPAPTLF